MTMKNGHPSGKTNSLSARQRFLLALWLEENLQRIEDHDLSKKQAVKLMTAELQFRVSTGNLQCALRGISKSWPGTKTRKSSTREDTDMILQRVEDLEKQVQNLRDVIAHDPPRIPNVTDLYR